MRSSSIFVFCPFSREKNRHKLIKVYWIWQGDSQIDKPQRGHPKRAELPDVNINKGAQSIITEKSLLKDREEKRKKENKHKQEAWCVCWSGFQENQGAASQISLNFLQFDSAPSCEEKESEVQPPDAEKTENFTFENIGDKKESQASDMPPLLPIDEVEEEPESAHLTVVPEDPTPEEREEIYEDCPSVDKAAIPNGI